MGIRKRGWKLLLFFCTNHPYGVKWFLHYVYSWMIYKCNFKRNPFIALNEIKWLITSMYFLVIYKIPFECKIFTIHFTFKQIWISLVFIAFLCWNWVYFNMNISIMWFNNNGNLKQKGELFHVLTMIYNL